MTTPEPDPILLARVAIMDAIDAVIRARAAESEISDALLAILIDERNRIARLLGRPEFTAPDLLARGVDD
ncbi:hypothetical protein [Benzoatithermus flavus]|uniref:Chorismate mutase n=1 Tax=Benzoatithermus flavus TaxID=3108223 RepID=A0ABU8XQH7_9PROT